MGEDNDWLIIGFHLFVLLWGFQMMVFPIPTLLMSSHLLQQSLQSLFKYTATRDQWYMSYIRYYSSSDRPNDLDIPISSRKDTRQITSVQSLTFPSVDLDTHSLSIGMDRKIEDCIVQASMEAMDD